MKLATQPCGPHTDSDVSGSDHSENTKPPPFCIGYFPFTPLRCCFRLAFRFGSSSAGADTKLMALAELGSAGAALLLCFSIASGVPDVHAPAWRPVP